MLEEKISTVKELDKQILSICNVGEIAKEIEDSDEIRANRHHTGAGCNSRNTSPVVFEEFLPAASGLNQASPGISPGTAPSQLSHHQSRSKLPKLGGDATKFRTFWDSFESAVDKNLGFQK